MSVELVRRATELTNGDGRTSDEELAEIFAPDVVMDFTVRVFNPQIYEGYSGLRQFREDSREVWEEIVISAEEVIEKGDDLFVLAHVRARGRGSGIEIDTCGAGVWTVRDGRLWRYRLLLSESGRDEALALLRDRSGTG